MVCPPTHSPTLAPTSKPTFQPCANGMKRVMKCTTKTTQSCITLPSLGGGSKKMCHSIPFPDCTFICPTVTPSTQPPTKVTPKPTFTPCPGGLNRVMKCTTKQNCITLPGVMGMKSKTICHAIPDCSFKCPPTKAPTTKPPTIPQGCCKGATAECFACDANVSIEKYCKYNPKTVGCETFTPIPTVDPTPKPTKTPAVTVDPTPMPTKTPVLPCPEPKCAQPKPGCRFAKGKEVKYKNGCPIMCQEVCDETKPPTSEPTEESSSTGMVAAVSAGSVLFVGAAATAFFKYGKKRQSVLIKERAERDLSVKMEVKLPLPSKSNYPATSPQDYV